MKVLFLGRVGELNDSNSMGTAPLGPLRGGVEYDPDLIIDWAVSRTSTSPDPHDRIRLRRMLAATGKARELSQWTTPELLDALASHEWDAVLSNHMPLAAQYRQMTDMPLVNLQVWPAVGRSARLLGHFYAGWPDVLNEALSSTQAPNLWESETMFRENLATIREYVSPKTLRWVGEHSMVMPLGIWVDDLDEVFKARQEQHDPALFWGGTVTQSVKGWDDVVEVYQVVQASTDCKVIVTCPNEQGTERVPVPESFEMHWEQRRLGFYQQMQRGDVFVCAAKYESYGLAWLEMLAAGLIGVYERSWWMKYILPDWYPFVSDSRAETIAMTTALIRDAPDGPLFREYVPRIRDWVREEHSIWTGGRRLVEGLSRWA